MRGSDTRQEGMFSYVSPESRIPKDHPLRPIREMVDDALKELSADFDVLYSHTGRRNLSMTLRHPSEEFSVAYAPSPAG